MVFQRILNADSTNGLRFQRQCHAVSTGDTDATLIRFFGKKSSRPRSRKVPQTPQKKARWRVDQRACSITRPGLEPGMAGSKPAVLPITPPGSAGRRNPSGELACQSRQLWGCFGLTVEELWSVTDHLGLRRDQCENMLMEPLPPLICQDCG